MKQSLLYRSDIKRRTPFHCDKNTTVNMITLATKKKCNQNLILYPERYTVILFKCRRLKTVKLGVSSRGEIVFFYFGLYCASQWKGFKIAFTVAEMNTYKPCGQTSYDSPWSLILPLLSSIICELKWKNCHPLSWRIWTSSKRMIVKLKIVHDCFWSNGSTY